MDEEGGGVVEVEAAGCCQEAREHLEDGQVKGIRVYLMFTRIVCMTGFRRSHYPLRHRAVVTRSGRGRVFKTVSSVLSP